MNISWRIARRELRGGLSGFRVFVACLALGVAAIASVQTLSNGIRTGLHSDARALLGGDVSARILYRDLAPAEQAGLAALGRTTQTIELRGMARMGDATALVEAKAVDDSYPLVGSVALASGQTLADALARKDGVDGAVVERQVLDRLGAGIGDVIELGEGRVRLTDVIDKEPDRIGSGGFTLGPRLLLSKRALDTTGLLQPGAMIYRDTKLLLNDAGNPRATVQRLRAEYPQAGWRLRDSSDAAPEFARFLARLTSFLTLVGLTALLVGGVGVSNAVASYLDGKVATIATLKCLGAPSRIIFRAYLIQIGALALLGAAIGLCFGMALPRAAVALLADLLPVSVRIGFDGPGLALAAAYGLLVAFAFSFAALGRAASVPAASLFRAQTSPTAAKLSIRVKLLLAATGLALVALALATSRDFGFAASFVAGAVAALALFRLAGIAIVRGARALGRPRAPTLRLALANLHRPGTQAHAVVLSLGLGLTVLVAIAEIEGNFQRQVQDELPAEAPSFFFLDIQPDQRDALRQAVESVPGAGKVDMVPALRGRIVAVRDVPPDQALVDKRYDWILRADRGITYAAAAPRNSTITEGSWWPADRTSGPPLVSVAKEVALAFGLHPGDKLSVDIVGRRVDATVANVRELDWGRLGINYTLVFAPGLLEAAPQTAIATVRSSAEAEPAIERAVTRGFANVTAVRVKDALATVGQLIGNIGVAVRAVAAVALVAGTLVLAGAVAAGHRRRVYDAVVLKVLGATRGRVLAAFLLEYGLLGLVTALAASGLGALVAWAVVTQVLDLRWTLLPGAMGLTALGAAGITLALGFVGTWRALSQKAAPLLRNQ
ncbi:MAG: glycosyl transferase family 1 [Rhodospirillales bacterium]|nr:glycosyl transferase family 1 [Rhodospirillales bacterium]